MDVRKLVEEWVRRNPEEAMRIVCRLFQPRELLRVGNRSYVRAFEDPLSRFDPGELRAMLDGGSCLPDPPTGGVIRDPRHLFTDFVTTEASYVIFGEDTDGDGVLDIIYAKNGRTGEIEFSGTDAATVIQEAIEALSAGGSIFIRSGRYVIEPHLAYISLRSRIRIISDGAVFELRFPDDKVPDDTFAFRIEDASYVEISGIHFELYGYGGSSNYISGAIKIDRSSNVQISNIEVLDKRGALPDVYWLVGVHIGHWNVTERRNKDIIIEYGRFYSDGRENRAFIGIRVSSAERVLIYECYLQARELDEPYNNKIGYGPLQIIASDDVRVCRSIVIGSHHNLIKTGVYDTETPDKCKRLLFRDLLLLGGFDDIIDPNYTDDSAVVGCIMDNTIGASGPEGDGISLERCANWTIAGNFIRATRAAVNTPSGSNPRHVITGNWLYGAIVGVQLSNTGTSVVSGNYIFSPSIGVLLEYPGVVTIAGNTIYVFRETDTEAEVCGIKAINVPTDVLIESNIILTDLKSDCDVLLKAYGIYAENSLHGVIKGNYIRPYAYNPPGKVIKRWLHLNRADGDYPCVIEDNVVFYDVLIQGEKTPIFRRNRGYTTENSGVETITGDGTTTTFLLNITHGLVSDNLTATFMCKRPATFKWWLVDDDNDGFYETIRVEVTFDTAPADEETVEIYWQAETT